MTNDNILPLSQIAPRLDALAEKVAGLSNRLGMYQSLPGAGSIQDALEQAVDAGDSEREGQIRALDVASALVRDIKGGAYADCWGVRADLFEIAESRLREV